MQLTQKKMINSIITKEILFFESNKNGITNDEYQKLTNC